MSRSVLREKLFMKNEYGYEHQNPSAVLSPEDQAFAKKEWNIDLELHRTCVNCQVRQMLKYEDTIDPETGEKATTFSIPCKGIKKNMPEGSGAILTRMINEQGIDPERAALLLQSTQDPVAWAELMFGFDDKHPTWYLRNYQKEQLRCTSQRIVIREGRRTGKALALDTAIPTPDGWTTMGDLKQGDRVFGKNGKPCNVTFVTEVQYDRDCYRVQFDDDSYIIADRDHQWSVQTESMRKDSTENKAKRYDLITLTTGDMVNHVKVDENKSNYSIPMAQSLQYVGRDVDLGIEPYSLGLWLGSGVQNTGRIPIEYLQASVNQRFELLNGLMNSSGTVENGTCEFTLSDPDLAESVYELILGLGFKVSKSVQESLSESRIRLLLNLSSQTNRYITSITKIDSVPVKCITVDSADHLYLAGRECIPTHNTFIVALKLLHFIFTRIVDLGRDAEGKPIFGGPMILIVTPYQSQLLNVFNEMETLLKRNKDLSSEVETASGGSLYVKTPFFHMDFKNMGKINGFVSGVGVKVDGSGGGTMRGQTAHIVYLDEMDMIPEETLDKVIMPILLSDLMGEVCFIATSTPIGKRGRFYKMCLEDPTFKEDYLPSTVLPQWDKSKKMILADATPEGIQTEYMAAFIDGVWGVFKPSYVYRARKDYTYEDTQTLAWWKKTFAITDLKQVIRCIGIDWNQNAGTEFVVMTYIPHVHKYVVTEAINIPSGEFSALRWREELIRLNYKWKPDYIYADKGYGHTIIEDLKLIAFGLTSKPNKTLQDIETTKLTERLKAFDFGANISLRNPVDGTVFEKGGKSFLVENSQRIFEDAGPTGQGIFWYPEDERQLKDELLHYSVLRRSVTTGKPIYGTESQRIGDHRLDAMMLALAGIQIEAGLYSEGNIPASAPTFLSKESLDKRQELDTPGSSFIKGLNKQKLVAPSALTLLQTMREGETSEQAAGRSHREDRVPRRSQRNEPSLNRVQEFFKNAPNYGGYDRDKEPLNNASEPHILKRRSERDRTIRRRGR